MTRSDLAAARAAWRELGKALDAAEFDAIDTGDWRYRVVIVALEALNEVISPAVSLRATLAAVGHYADSPAQKTDRHKLKERRE